MPAEQIQPGDIVTFKANVGRSDGKMTAGEITNGMVQVYWLTKEGEIRIGSVPAMTLAKVG